MKFSNFLFPESKTPADDFSVIEESLDEAVLTDELGFDAVWLGSITSTVAACTWTR